MTNFLCPVTRSGSIKLLEELSVSSICAYYENALGIDVSEYFEGLEYIGKYQSTETGYVFFHPFDIAGDEGLYEQLENFDWYYLENKWEHQEALRFVRSNDIVLEIGCGEGAFLSMLSRNNHKAIGLELNRRAIAAAKQKKLEVINQTIEAYASQGQPVDVVCMFQVLEHISDIHAFIAESLKALNSGGKLIISVPNNESFIRHDHENALNLPPHHMGRWNAKSLTSLSRTFPLKVVDILFEPLQDYHVKWYTTVFLKNWLGRRIYNYVIKGTVADRYAERFFRKRRKQLIGHSIMAIYQKL